MAKKKKEEVSREWDHENDRWIDIDIERLVEILESAGEVKE